MAGLYSRVVYTLWFKRDVHDNQLAFQQRVSVLVEGLHSKESRNIVMFVVMYSDVASVIRTFWLCY